MKILIVTDYSLEHTKGGAQRSNDIIIKKGVELGHDITVFNYDSDLNLLTQEYDHVISSNLERINGLYPSIVTWLASLQNHSRLEHDKCSYLNPEQRKSIFSNCVNTFFLSQYHQHLFESYYGSYFKNIRIVADPIDVETFCDKNKTREDKILNVGFMHNLKGTETFFNYAISNPNIEFVVAGWGSPCFEHVAKTLPNVNFLGTVDYSSMPDLYNKYTKLFYVPFIEEPFCRSVAEARLCGMEVITNNNIGSMHELNRLGEDGFRQECKNASENFWSFFE